MRRNSAHIEAKLAAEAELLDSLDLDTLPTAMPCIVCRGEFEPTQVRLRQGRHGMVCPACLDTPRGRQELESHEQRDRRLFGWRPRRKR